ncbi:MAG TPA: response regulator transcription factor [Rhodocyclaceae bacterium]|nr:response regulator transcription factor [Rhodocyclaceae bacterium]
MTRILIVEDHALVCEAMAQTLARLETGVECVEARGSEEALAQLAASTDWDLAVVDLMLPGLNGFSLLGVMAKRFPDVPAMVVSGLDDPVSVQRALKAGASGFVPKSSSGDELRRAVRTVLDGGVYVPSGVGTGAARSGPPSERFGLTNAQARVLELLAQGKTNREIADLLGLSEGTVKVHMSAILRALNVRNRAQALLVISRSGMPLL